MARIKIAKDKLSLSSSGKSYIVRTGVSHIFNIPKFAVTEKMSGKIRVAYHNGEEIALDALILTIKPRWFNNIEHDLKRLGKYYKLLNR